MKRRLVFWPLFLIAAAAFGIYAYNRGIEQQCRRNLRLLGHPHANVAAQAWRDLRQLYLTKWKAYEYIIDHLDDDRPISFLVQRDPDPTGNRPGNTIFSARGKPIYYRNPDRIYCRTVREAILAFIYDERKWKVEFNGDWKQWWEENKGYYGRP